MTVIAVLICLSLVVALIFLAAFIWSCRSGQYDDIFGDSVRLLFDDKKREEKKEANGKSEK
ncbi:MAG: cbb3-type cytochrome oxidase assembly protein CcoS [Candidatus Nephrothrix sp. EaCA]|nr:MAG: cbb3-type cytochrome oxidase assembly protein CcoS [Candidatus Nephrothrix sp. EaCA]